MVISRTFILFYIVVILTPAFRVLDIIAAQALYLNFLNFFSTAFIIYQIFSRKKDEKPIGTITINIVAGSFFIFLLWCSVTVLWAINKSEALRTLSEIFTTILAFINLLFHLSRVKNKFNFIFLSLLVMQLLEISFLIYDYMIDLSQGIFTPGSMRYIGLTGNKNIASFSILIKIPVLIYFTHKYKGLFSKLLKSLSYGFIFLSTYSILYITLTRGAQLALVILVFLFVCFSFYQNLIRDRKTLKFIKEISKIIAPIFLAVIVGNLFSKNEVSVNDNIATAFENVDSSTNERLRFYSYALEIIKDNFFTGTGIGSWELESIEKDRLEMKSYVVPYHTHNDFLEIFTETGVFGFLFFYAPIFIIFFLLLKHAFFNKIKQETDKYFLLFLMLSMYLIDATINFPFARVIQNINLIFILSISIFLLHKTNSSLLSHKYPFFIGIKTILISLFLISPLGIYSSVRQFKSSRDQVELLYAFNTNNFKVFSKKELERIERSYPDLTLTTLPISTIIGLHYYYNFKEYDKAEQYLREGIKANPYLNVNQSYIGKIHEKRGNLDSARYYTKYAFEKMPNNPVHFAHYVQVLIKEYDTIGIKEAYDKVIYKDRDPRFGELYLLAMSGLLDKDEGKMVLNDIKKNQLKSDGLKASYYVLELGKERVIEGFINYKTAEDLFKKNEFSTAAKFYDLAFEKNPLEYPYIENAAISYLRAGDLDNAMQRISIVIENMDKSNVNGKAFYIKGLIFLEKDQRKEACEEFEKALKNGFNSNTALSSYCR